MRLASIILASVPLVVLIGLLGVLFTSTGPEGFGVFFLMLYACAFLTVLSVIASKARPRTALILKSER